MTESVHNGSIHRQIALPPMERKTQFAAYLRKGFRRLSGMGGYSSESVEKDLGRPLILDPLAFSKDQMVLQEEEEEEAEDSYENPPSLHSYLNSLPRVDPVNRTLVWVLYSDEGELGDLRDEDLQPLPRRGALQPRLVFTPAPSRQETELTSVSRCESDRGTNGRGTPPVRDDEQPRMDELFQRLQERQRKVLSGHLHYCGNLSYLHPMKNSPRRQSLEPLQATPELTADIAPFIAPPPHAHLYNPLDHSDPPPQGDVKCRNSNNLSQLPPPRQKISDEEPSSHRTRLRTLPHHNSFPSVDKPLSKIAPQRRMSYNCDSLNLERPPLQPLAVPGGGGTRGGNAQVALKPKSNPPPPKPCLVQQQQITKPKTLQGGENPSDGLVDVQSYKSRPAAAKGPRTRPLPYQLPCEL